MISITKIIVRDTDAKSDMALIITPRSEIVQSDLPRSWTLSFQFSGRFRQATFSIDAGPPHIELWPPYCPAGDNIAINLPVGQHMITVAVDDQPAEVVTFAIAAAPIAVPATPGACSFGSNAEGVTHPSGDPVLHPELLATCRALNFEYLRLWTDGEFKSAFAANCWNIPRKWADGGIKVLAVLNFQNSPGHRAPSDEDWLLKIRSLPSSADSGVWGICLGNECDTATYYAGSVAQLVHLMELAYSILKAKGYVVIAPSTIRSLDWVKQLVAAGAMAFCDYLDFHVYEANADAGLAKVDAFLAYCLAVNARPIVSECGIRGSAHDLVGWSRQVAAFFTGLKSRTGIFLQFPLCWLPESNDPLCQMAPLGRDSRTANEPFASVWKGIETEVSGPV